MELVSLSNRSSTRPIMTASSKRQNDGKLVTTVDEKPNSSTSIEHAAHFRSIKTRYSCKLPSSMQGGHYSSRAFPRRLTGPFRHSSLIIQAYNHRQTPSEVLPSSTLQRRYFRRYKSVVSHQTLLIILRAKGNERRTKQILSSNFVFSP